MDRKLVWVYVTVRPGIIVSYRLKVTVLYRWYQLFYMALYKEHVTASEMMLRDIHPVTNDTWQFSQSEVKKLGQGITNWFIKSIEFKALIEFSQVHRVSSQSHEVNVSSLYCLCSGNYGFISLLLPRLHKLPSQCCSNEVIDLGNLSSNK